MSKHNLILCRSDQGDGGWSLHTPGTTDEQIAEGYEILASGDAEMVDGEWNRPNVEDYTTASEKLVDGRQ